jgi:hypothetical protein
MSRCAGCGKDIEPEQIVARVAIGTVGPRGAFQEQKEWGKLHKECFDRAVDNPDAVFNAIQKQAQDVDG